MKVKLSEVRMHTFSSLAASQARRSFEHASKLPGLDAASKMDLAHGPLSGFRGKLSTGGAKIEYFGNLVTPQADLSSFQQEVFSSLQGDLRQKVRSLVRSLFHEVHGTLPKGKGVFHMHLTCKAPNNRSLRSLSGRNVEAIDKVLAKIIGSKGVDWSYGLGVSMDQEFMEKQPSFRPLSDALKQGGMKIQRVRIDTADNDSPFEIEKKDDVVLLRLPQESKRGLPIQIINGILAKGGWNE